MRISQHPRNPEQEAVDIEIGDYEGARYPLKSWYLGLRDIAAGIMVTEVTRIFSRMVAEEEIKRKPVNKQFQTVMQNVAKKARKGQHIPMTELDAKTRIALLEDFASRFQFKKHAFNVDDSKFIGFQQGNGKRILWVALSPFDRYTVPPGTEWQEILSFGSWKGARYMSNQWHTVIENIAFQFGFKSRGARKALNRFIREKKALYAPAPETGVVFKP